MLIDSKNLHLNMAPSSMYPPPPPYSLIAASWQHPSTPSTPPPPFARGISDYKGKGLGKTNDIDSTEESGPRSARHLVSGDGASAHTDTGLDVAVPSSTHFQRPGSAHSTGKGKARAQRTEVLRFSALPSHILLQIVYSTFPQTDEMYECETVSKVERQRENLFWLETSLRLVNRAFYIACMHILRSTYLSAYNSLIRSPYTSNPLATPSSCTGFSSRNNIFAATHRELPTLDLFIALLAQEDVLLDSSELYTPREDAYKDLFDYIQPRSRLEDLVMEEGIRVGVIVVECDVEEESGTSSEAQHATLSGTIGDVAKTPASVAPAVNEGEQSAPASNLPPLPSPIVLQYTGSPLPSPPPSPSTPANNTNFSLPPSASASPTKSSFSLSRIVSSYREKASAKKHLRKSLVPSPYPLTHSLTPTSPQFGGSTSGGNTPTTDASDLSPTGAGRRRREERIIPLPFSSLSVSFSPRTVKLIYDPQPNPNPLALPVPATAAADTSQHAFGGSTFGSLSLSGVSHGRWKKRTLVEVGRGRDETLEESAKWLVRRLKEFLEEDDEI